MKNGRYEEYGEVRWFKDDELHREDEPARIWSDGTIGWYRHGKLHRVGCPAIKRVDGTKKWLVDGKYHRLNGPAVEYPSGRCEWWVDGVKINITDIFGYEPSVPLTEGEQVILRLRV